MKPPIIFYEGNYTEEELVKLKREQVIWKIVDIYEKQLAELFEITNPHLKLSKNYNNQLNEYIISKKANTQLQGNWVYFPWNGTLVHCVTEAEYLKLRTNRNKNLITSQEQDTLINACVGIVGLSVGSGLAVGLSYQGIANNLKLAEFDTLETTNLNRIRTGIQNIGKSKISVVQQQIYEVNPYAKLSIFDKGLSKELLTSFVHQNPQPKLIFEIIDDFEMKIHLRIAARSAGIPIVTPANLGDSILFDIERYDLNPNLELFNGLLGDLHKEILKNPTEDSNKYAIKMVGIQNVPQRAIESVKEINKTLVGRPQLSSTVSTSSSLGTFLARKILLGDTQISGRIRVDFNEIFNILN